MTAAPKWRPAAWSQIAVIVLRRTRPDLHRAFRCSAAPPQILKMHLTLQESA
jgi:hypothetical protein